MACSPSSLSLHEMSMAFVPGYFCLILPSRSWPLGRRRSEPLVDGVLQLLRSSSNRVSLSLSIASSFASFFRLNTKTLVQSAFVVFRTYTVASSRTRCQPSAPSCSAEASFIKQVFQFLVFCTIFFFCGSPFNDGILIFRCLDKGQVCTRGDSPVHDERRALAKHQLMHLTCELFRSILECRRFTLIAGEDFAEHRETRIVNE